MGRLYSRKKAVFLFLFFYISFAMAGKPLWTINPAPNNNPSQTVYDGTTTTIDYIVVNQSRKQKNLTILPQPGMTQSSICHLMPRGQAGSSCTLTLTFDGSNVPPQGIKGGPLLCVANSNGTPNSNQCYQPARSQSLNIKKGEGFAFLSVSPSVLLFAENTTGQLTVTNLPNSSVQAVNVSASIPGGSNIIVQSTTCGSTLDIGASCNITLFSATQEGPTEVSISGVNTDTVSSNVTVTSQPSISISNPVQSDRIVPVQSLPALSLEITNDVGSVINADGITVTDKTNCPDLTVDSSNCTSVAPGNSCNLLLTTNTTYVPCTITIGGTNTINSPTTLVAFSYLDGLVFSKNAGVGTVVALGNEYFGRWTNVSTAIAGINGSNGTSGIINTDIIVLAAPCTGSPANCAAQHCKNIGPEWYLPLNSELLTIASQICRNPFLSPDPCTFGNFVVGGYYFSSRQYVNNTAQTWNVIISTRQQFETNKTSNAYARCARLFVY